MAHLYQRLGPRSDYYDKKSGYSPVQWEERLQQSTTIYIGNLSFYTTEDQIYELFGKCGEIDQVVMGLNRQKGSPCGFCFLRFESHAAANVAVEIMNGILLDGRIIRVDWDSGDGITDAARRYGRGIHGMQWRDEFRRGFDPARGGEGGGLEHSQFAWLNGGRDGAGYKRRAEEEDEYGHYARYRNPDIKIAKMFATPEESGA